MSTFPKRLAELVKKGLVGSIYIPTKAIGKGYGFTEGFNKKGIYVHVSGRRLVSINEDGEVILKLPPVTTTLKPNDIILVWAIDINELGPYASQWSFASEYTKELLSIPRIIKRFHKKLFSRKPVLDDLPDCSDSSTS